MADRTPWLRPLPLLLAVGLLLPAVLAAAVPPAYRPWGFAAFGAVGLFLAARGGRLGLPLALLLAIGGRLAYDLLKYAVTPVELQFQDKYWPFHDAAMEAVLFGSLALYPVLGWLARRRSGHPLVVGGAAVTASVVFFLVTNFGSWVQQDLPYPQTLAGLLDCYRLAVPFYRGTFASDLLFTALLFGAEAALLRATAPTPVPVPAEAPVRS